MTTHRVPTAVRKTRPAQGFDRLHPALPWIVGCVGAALLAANVAGPARAQDAPRWTQVRRGPFRQVLLESGDIEAVRSHRLNAPMVQQSSLQIVRLVPEGTAVQPGDTLVQFDASPLETGAEETRNALEQGRAELRRIEAEQTARRLGLENAIRSAEFALEQADLQVEKLEYESEARREEARISRKRAQVSLDAARAKLAAQTTLDSLAVARTQRQIAGNEARLQRIHEYLDQVTLLAPASGLVVYAQTGWRRDRRKIRLGDEIQPGSMVVEIPDLARMDVVFDVHEVDRQKVAEGMPARVALQAYPDRVFDATLLNVAPLALAPDSQSRVRWFSVRARIDGSDPILKPGMSAQVAIVRDTEDSVLRVSLESVFEREGKAVVFPRSTWPQARVIALGPRNDSIAVVRDGLAEGDQVAAAVPEGADDVHPLGYAEFQSGPGWWEETTAPPAR
jgi:RND family efflux transporter MFP subunit